MRIFHLVPNLNYGGLQKVVELLAIRQREAGHAVTIGCWTYRSNHPEAEEKLAAAGVRIVYLRRGADGQMSHGKLDLIRKLRSYLGAGRADILHIHNPFGYYIYGALAGLSAGTTRTINTIHLTAMFDHPNFGLKGNALFWISAMMTDGVVSVCQEVDDYLSNRFDLPARKRFVVENGIDLTPFLAVPDRVRREELVFGFAGRMAPEKNHHVLIDAFAKMRKKYSHIRLRLLGGGGLDEKLREQVRNLGLDDVVEFCGFGHDVPGFLSTLDVYVLPSKFEAHPLSLMEAIASGLPVVATAVGGVAKIVRSTDSGWLCKPNSVEALFAAMEKAIQNPDRGERTRRARKLAAELYSDERMAADHEALYRKLMAGAPSDLSRSLPVVLVANSVDGH